MTIKEVYNVTWTVHASEAKDFISNRRTKKQEFLSQSKRERGQSGEPQVEHTFRSYQVQPRKTHHDNPTYFDRGFEDIGSSAEDYYVEPTHSKGS